MKNKPVFSMKNTTGKKSIKVQLDHRTVITISNIEKLKAWLYRFPEAKVITT